MTDFTQVDQFGGTTQNLGFDAMPVFADNAAALLGGLTVGKLYHTVTGEVRIVV